MDTVTMTTSIIYPCLGTDKKTTHKKSMLNAYLLDAATGDATFGGFLSVNYDMDRLKNKEIQGLRKHKYYLSDYHPTPNTLLIKYKFPKKVQKNIVRPFVEGKYSKIDRTYVKEHFSQWKGREGDSDSTPSVNWAILNKSPFLKEYWEDRIQTLLPEKAEVWGIINQEDETFSIT